MDLYNIIKKQRERRLAPVDTIGCSSIYDLEINELKTTLKTYESKNNDLKTDLKTTYIGCSSSNTSYYTYKELDIKRFQLLVSLILSSQTKDEVTFQAILNLNKKLNPLSLETVKNATIEEINNCIGKVGYHNKKSIFIKNIKTIPLTLFDTLKINGVGKKMAYLYMYYGFNKICGVAVDTHVHRISNRIGLVETKNPEKKRI